MDLWHIDLVYAATVHGSTSFIKPEPSNLWFVAQILFDQKGMIVLIIVVHLGSNGGGLFGETGSAMGGGAP
jgi:hypothetical protein